MVHVIEHPLVQAELTGLRCRNCPGPEFRQRLRRIASLMVPAVTAGFETRVIPCETPLEVTSGVKVARKVILTPILRAGLGFLDGFFDLLPDASIAHIGLARNEETLLPSPTTSKPRPPWPRARSS
jgi:uracil phosphoribosyltransferase